MMSALIPQLNKRSLVLASGSPRRKDLLNMLVMSLDFTVKVSKFAEDLDKAKYAGKPEAYVLDNARLKAEDVMATTPEPANLTLIACDTVVYHDSRIVEKPRDSEHAKKMLASLSGQWHEVYSGVTLMSRREISQPLVRQFSARSRVRFGDLSPQLIQAYVDTKEPLDKAGGYGMQGEGSLLVESIEGDYFNIIGLPLYQLRVELAQHLEEL